MHAERVRQELEQFVDGQPHGAELVIKKITRHHEVTQWQVVFLSEEDLLYVSSILSLVEGSLVLTITDVPELTKKGAMIVMKIENQRMIFETNLETAQKAGLQLSSRLLNLAKKIH